MGPSFPSHQSTPLSRRGTPGALHGNRRLVDSYLSKANKTKKTTTQQPSRSASETTTTPTNRRRTDATPTPRARVATTVDESPDILAMPDFSHHQLPFQNASSSEEDSDSEDEDHETPSSYLRQYESPAGMKPIDRLDLSRQLKNLVVTAIVKAQRELESHFGELFGDFQKQIKASQEQNLELLNQTKDLKNQISRLHTELTGVKKRLQQPPSTAASASPPQQTAPPAGPKQKATSYAAAAAQGAKPAAHITQTTPHQLHQNRPNTPYLTSTRGSLSFLGIRSTPLPPHSNWMSKAPSTKLSKKLMVPIPD